MSKLTGLNAALNPYNLYVTSWSPGDGATRYRFHRVSCWWNPESESTETTPLFGEGLIPLNSEGSEITTYTSALGLHTALGWKEARLYAEGLLDGLYAARFILG